MTWAAGLTDLKIVLRLLLGGTMNRNILHLLLTLFTALTLSCSSGGPQSAEEALDERGLTDVLDQAADEEYTPPENGVLTAAQVEMFVKVKEREVELLEVASKRFQESATEAQEADEKGNTLESMVEGLDALKKLSDLITTDIRAAQELGYSSGEYQWVKGQILVADITVQGAEMQKKMASFGLEKGQEPNLEEIETDEVKAARANLELMAPHKERIDQLLKEASNWQKAAQENNN